MMVVGVKLFISMGCGVFYNPNPAAVKPSMVCTCVDDEHATSVTKVLNALADRLGGCIPHSDLAEMIQGAMV